MKRLLTTFIGFLILLLITGCGKSKINSTSAMDNTVKKAVVTKYYQNLSSTDKKLVKFKFSEDQDETEDNYADPVYVISVKITNKSNKIIKFDKSKFLIYVSEQTKFPSNKQGILALKPGQTKSINQLIENVAEQALVGGGSYFIYLNTSNKLAAADFTIKSPARSESNQGNTMNSDSTKETSSDSSMSQSSQQSNTSSTDKNSDSNDVITSADMAASLYAHSMALDPAIVKAVPVDGGYQIVEPDYASRTIVNSNGNITNDDGSTSSFDELKQPTQKDPNGWHYNK